MGLKRSSMLPSPNPTFVRKEKEETSWKDKIKDVNRKTLGLSYEAAHTYLY
jgi:hypothetical protein